MRNIFRQFILRSREDMRGYIQNDAESLTEAQQDELERLLLQYDAEGCEDPLAFALNEIYRRIGDLPAYDEEDCDLLEE